MALPRWPRRSARAPRSNGVLRRELSSRKLSTGLGDEGGFAPEITEPEEVLRLLVQAITDAGYKPGLDGVSIALDLAASEFRQSDGRYKVAGDLLDSDDMIERLAAESGGVQVIELGVGKTRTPPVGDHRATVRRTTDRTQRAKCIRSDTLSVGSTA